MAVEKDYAFEGPNGAATLLDLFEDAASSSSTASTTSRTSPLMRRRFVSGAGLRWLLVPRRPGRPPRSPERARHDVTVRLARLDRDPGPEGAHGLAADPGTRSRTTSTRISTSTRGTAPTPSSATATGSSAPTSSTPAATRRWAPPGPTLTSPRSAARRREDSPEGYPQTPPSVVELPRHVRRRRVIDENTTLRMERTYHAPVYGRLRRLDQRGGDQALVACRARLGDDRGRIDLRIGGAVRVVMRNPHEDIEYGGGGVYTEIDPPNRLAFTWIWTTPPRASWSRSTSRRTTA